MRLHECSQTSFNWNSEAYIYNFIFCFAYLQDALRTFLLRKLDNLAKDDKCQITMISTWATELYLDKVLLLSILNCTNAISLPYQSNLYVKAPKRVSFFVCTAPLCGHIPLINHHHVLKKCMKTIFETCERRVGVLVIFNITCIVSFKNILSIP